MKKSALEKKKWPLAIKLYQSGLSMNLVAKEMSVSLNVITYILRKSNIKRRSASEARKIVFESEPVTFKIRHSLSVDDKVLEAIGVTLYWGEGYKSTKASGIDFANSDPRMVIAFMRFLRWRYKPDEKRIKILLYCYADQNISKLISFWSWSLNVPKSQFTKPYVRQDYRAQGRKMKHGLVHIRYSDKKMLIDLLNLVESYRLKYCVGTQVVNEGTL